MDLPKRKRNRLEGFDYSLSGCYYITVCTTNRLHIFWEFVGADMIRPDQPPLSDIGKIVQQGILQIPSHYEGVFLDKYCIMPDHIHLIVRIDKDDECGQMGAAPTISTVIGSLKRWISRQVGPIWQKSFYDHCIRNEKDYNEIWEYIDQNPLKYKLGYRRN